MTPATAPTYYLWKPAWSINPEKLSPSFQEDFADNDIQYTKSEQEINIILEIYQNIPSFSSRNWLDSEADTG